jgi:hypothetical protein
MFVEAETSIKSSYIGLVHVIIEALFTNVSLYYIEKILFYLHEGLGRWHP